jgi:hypothetical protein
MAFFYNKFRAFFAGTAVAEEAVPWADRSSTIQKGASGKELSKESSTPQSE